VTKEFGQFEMSLLTPLRPDGAFLPRLRAEVRPFAFVRPQTLTTP